MGKIVKRHLPCLDQVNCGSSDARSIYDDGTSFCFSCKEYFPKEPDKELIKPSLPAVRSKDIQTTLKTISELRSKGHKPWKISDEVFSFFDVKVGFNSDGEISAHYYPYDGGKAYKKRELPKQFSWVGKSAGLFGKEKFSSAGAKIIITEGEKDALAVAQASLDKYGRIYPVVALSSATWAEKTLIEEREWLRSFSEVVICFDEDEAGEDARKVAIKVIGLDKVRITKLPDKDAADVYLSKGASGLYKCLFEASAPIPSGFITKETLWQRVVALRNTPSVPYPAFLAGVTSRTKGTRKREISTFISGTSCGKSTMMREIGMHYRSVTGERVGIVALEESPEETAVKLSAMTLMRNPANEEISEEDLKKGYDEVFENDGYIILDHGGSLNDGSIIDKMEYMALSGCGTIILDHLTILVSEGAEGLTGNEAVDKVMNDLLLFVQRRDVSVKLVSHLRKTQINSKSFEEGRMPTLDDIKGSGSIKQVSHNIIAFARHMTHEDPKERNRIDISVLKCRFTGLTGPAGSAFYDFPTGRMKPFEESVEDFIRV